MVVAHHWLAALHKSSQIRGAKVALALSGGGIQVSEKGWGGREGGDGCSEQ